MMVSKVAVIALVAIISVPILLGYALNLTEVTETDYKQSDDVLNVTPLLQDGYSYSYAAANVIDLNSRFYQAGSPTTPDYSTSTTKSGIQISKNVLAAGTIPTYTDMPATNALYYNVIFNYNPSVGYVSANLTFNDNTTGTVVGIHSVYWDKDNQGLYITRYYYNGSVWSDATLFAIFDNVQSISYSKTAGYNGTGEQFIYWDFSPPTTYVNLSAGYVLNKYTNSLAAGTTNVELPWHSNNVLLTMDLSSITASSYSYKVRTSFNPGIYYLFEKTTVSSEVHWKLKVSNTENGTYQELTELYYDPSKSSNTYQIFIDLNATSFRYVGAWPTLIGAANSYWEYKHEHNLSLSETTLTFMGVTPKIRIDAADYRAFQYPLIEDETYDPSQFKSNPATTIGNPSIYGTSITFGGNTYTVSEGNITLGTHEIPVNGLVLSSLPNPSGGYDNKIGNTVISTTAQPSTITFNGQWSASISTTAQEEYEYTKTEWIAGSFAWDGVDQNFLMVGLITCLGVFIALGVYGRRSGARVLPLMIVCGGAALLFFVML